MDERETMTKLTLDGWTVKTKDGRLTEIFFECSRRTVESRVVGTHYDPAALISDRAYRALFERELADTLEHSGDTIVPVQMTLTEVEASRTLRSVEPAPMVELEGETPFLQRALGVINTLSSEADDEEIATKFAAAFTAIRAEAIEECAKVARDWGWSSRPDHAHGIADAVLALKTAVKP